MSCYINTTCLHRIRGIHCNFFFLRVATLRQADAIVFSQVCRTREQNKQSKRKRDLTDIMYQRKANQEKKTPAREQCRRQVRASPGVEAIFPARHKLWNALGRTKQGTSYVPGCKAERKKKRGRINGEWPTTKYRVHAEATARAEQLNPVRIHPQAPSASRASVTGIEKKQKQRPSR